MAEKMTAFSPTNLPADINTVEKLNAWSAAVLAAVNFSETIVESAGTTPVPVATTTVFDQRTTDYTGYRAISRTSLPVAQNFAGAGQWYDSVQELSTDPIPSQFTV